MVLETFPDAALVVLGSPGSKMPYQNGNEIDQNNPDRVFRRYCSADMKGDLRRTSPEKTYGVSHK